MKKRVMPIKTKHIDFSIGALKYVMARRFRKNKYTHVLYRGNEYTCRTVPFDIIPNGNIFINF